MLTYLAKRLAMAVVIIFAVVSLSFFMIRLMPGNAVSALTASLQQQGGMTPAQIQQRVNEIYGVTPHGPVLQQYGQYVMNVLHGNLGRSVTNPGETVSHIIITALPWTILIVGLALIISFLIGIGVGTVMSVFRETKINQVLTVVVSLLSAIPNYLVAILLLYQVADMHKILPGSGAYSVNVRPGWTLAFIGSVASHAILPIAAYVITSFGGWALAMKGSSISVLGSEYVRAAEARGLSSRRIAQSYIGRNSMLPMVTSLALSIGFMFGGSVFIETYFTYPGIGYYLIEAVNARDYSLMMGCFLLITVSVVVANLLVDLLYPLIDPRIASPAHRHRVDTERSRLAGQAGLVGAGSSKA